MKLDSIRMFAGTIFCAAMAAVLASAQSPPTTPPEEAYVQRGLALSPVPLNLTGKDRAKVGYGSYLINALGGCNDCHTNPSFDPTGDPYRGMAKKINTAGYLGGGVAFGPFTSRNITPDKTGEIVGGLANFKQMMRTGIDLKKLHPEISPLLQVMPWPIYGEASDRDLESMYAFLTAIPCLEGGLGELPNRCAPAATTTAVASPKELTVASREVRLDATKSTSATGALTYRWIIPAGSPQAAISRADTATPLVQLVGRNTYKFEVTVTDAAGKTSADTATITYVGR